MRWLWHRTCVPKFRLKPIGRKPNWMPASQRKRKKLMLHSKPRDTALGGLDAAARDIVGDVMQAVGLGAPDDSDIDVALKAAQEG